MQRGTRQDSPFETHRRHEQVDGRHDTGDGAYGIQGIGSADRAFAGASRHEEPRDQRQGHARTKGHRHHERDRNGLGDQGESEIAGFGARERLHRPGNDVEGVVVARDRQGGQRSHDQQDLRKEPHRVGQVIDPAANPQAAHRQAENEGSEHELKGMRRTAQRQAQHANPRHLVEKRNEAGYERCRREPVEAPIIAVGLRLRCGIGRWWLSLCEEPDKQGKQDVEQASREQSSGQAHPIDQEEPADENPDRGAETVGEVQERQELAGPARSQPDEPATDEREGGSQQNRLGRISNAPDVHLKACTPLGGAQAWDDRQKTPVEEPLKDRVKKEAKHANRKLDDCIGEQQPANPQGAARYDPCADGHAAHENRENEGLRVRGVPEKELQVVRPDRLVYEPREARTA